MLDKLRSDLRLPSTSRSPVSASPDGSSCKACVWLHSLNRSRHLAWDCALAASFDKGFLAAEILCGLTMGGRNRHFLIPGKSNSCWEVIAGTGDDATVRMRVSPQARKKCPALPEFWNARAIRIIDPRGRERVLLTSLGDRRRFKPTDILACYERRWQIETSYHELKQSMLGSELTLRSRTVEGVYQEIWGR